MMGTEKGSSKVWLMLLTATAAWAGPLGREPNDSLRMPQTPKRFGITTERAFAGLRFTDPVAIATPLGETNRLFVVEQAGVVGVITNLASPSRTVFLNLRRNVVSGGERGLLGLAFHPGYATNGHFFVFYTLNTTTSAGGGLHNRLSRFQVSADDPNLADPDSELPLITQRDDAGNHNGGDLHFGPDGYLYVALGDEGGANDVLGNSQRIDRDFFAGVLRIDVDRRAGSVPPNPHPANEHDGTIRYAIPPDNPFLGATTFDGRTVDPDRVRTEFWAVGLRNPWRMSFDPETGLLYCGDVGQDRLEEILILRAGGNYGWNYWEGTRRGPRRNPPAGVVFEPPLLEYTHGTGTNQGRSVTGGVVYRGSRFPRLYGAYVFADYVSGHVWATRYTGQPNPPMEWLTTDTGIAAFGVDPRDGEILLADQNQDTLKRLVAGDAATGEPLPETLGETGAFADLALLHPSPGLVPYELNVPFWSDGAVKQRWFSIPDPEPTIAFHPTAPWTFPAGTVWVKHFEIELVAGDPRSLRRLETRFLVRNQDGVYGATYRWDEDQEDAQLVPAEGFEESFQISADGGVRTQVWRYPSRSECLACHTPEAGWALSFNTAQLNRSTEVHGQTAHQLEALSDAGYFDSAPPDPATLPRLSPASDDSVSLTRRVRSYLQANCASCHQPSAGALGFWDARFSTSLAESGIVNGALNDAKEDPANRVVVPGSTGRSMLLDRIARRGSGQMPPLASSRLDSEGVALMSEWIAAGLIDYTPPTQTFPEWQEEHFGATTAAAAQPQFDADEDQLLNEAEYFLDLDPRSAASRWRARIAADAEGVRLGFPQVANHGFELRLETAPTPHGPWRPSDLLPPADFIGDGTYTLQDPHPESPAMFYRVRLLPP